MEKVITKIKTLISNLMGSMDHAQTGYSQKKIIGYVFVLLVIFLHLCVWKYQFRLDNFENIAYILGTDLTFLAALLGLNYIHEKNITNQ